MSTSFPRAALVVAALALLVLAGCGPKAKPATGETASPGAVDSLVHVVVDSTPAPTMNKAVRSFEPVVIPGQSSGAGAPGEQAPEATTTPSTESASPTLSTSSESADTSAAGPRRPKVKRRVPK